MFSKIKQKKAALLILNDKIFKLRESSVISLYICKGSKGTIYELLFNKISGKINCNCNNLRLTPCYHADALRELLNKEK